LRSRLAAVAAALFVLAVIAAVGATSPPNEAGPLSVESAGVATGLRDRISVGSRASEWVRELTERAGPRLAGSPGDKAAVAVALETMKTLGFAKVHAERVVVPVWVRGSESGEITAPVSQKLALAALGESVATPEGGIEAEVIGVKSFEELQARKADVARKIVFFDVPTQRTKDGSGYGKSVVYRSEGPSRAARLGAVAVLVRSIGTDVNRLPHTGALQYEADAPKIPAAALSIPDADLLAFVLARGKPVRVRMALACGMRPDAESANVVGEIPGREAPDEIVVLGAHLDSWDLGRGAIDDGAGCGIVLEALRQIASLPTRPRRTIRVVLFANEENGLAGGKAYAAAHAAELGKHVAALESDSGTGRPLGFSWNAGPSAEPVIRAIGDLLEPLGAGELQGDGGGGADIGPLRTAGVPLFSVRQDASRYFDYHHTANDTFDKIDAEALDRNVAAVAAFAWVAASLPHELERIPPEKRTPARSR